MRFRPHHKEHYLPSFKVDGITSNVSLFNVSLFSIAFLPVVELSHHLHNNIFSVFVHHVRLKGLITSYDVATTNFLYLVTEIGAIQKSA